MPPVKPARPAPHKPSAADSTYTFTTLRPLAHLPDPSRALAYLERLRSDPGVRAVMRKYRWTVPVLAEMEPLGNTDAHSRCLGRNHGGGALIEVRLRTDAYDGYRHYRTVRKTIAHELAHNVFGDHDAAFWELCKRLEREIEAADWHSGGRPLTDQVFYEPSPERLQTADDGVQWTGGVQKLGGGSSSGDGGGGSISGGSSSSSGGGGGAAASRREMMARAAEERMKRLVAASGGSA